ncbi:MULTISPECIES: divalent-cation tolerance protein CutA [Proteus]|jgi:periplasmic divalent cation tolerance protein|uniref:Divalent-cation tolerance protein (C-type cytochrome biogenesis protein) n=1 Tax=Proteus vulgaris TaxID=585 RepID=A0A379FD90_PROVU|nr:MULTISPECIES: divalent-cation tolerance protein CutA [Proteus]NBN60567.1 divalent cation tolerance protein CutA [Proteus sp. G2639]RNT28844.1 divalent-cation tolerance protein CutA [Proteus mirabilis]KGA59480.1 cutA1 divalent ion tolerance family protein [Proteus vulgaris]MBG5971818.1 divalent-cation tolerance protein CutA [Proteus vulgaris]MBG5983657.1 divalent-cation tolerance protein CutA [Proteus vulgaris]
MIIAYSTAPNEKIANEIAHNLINAKLAACVNLIPQIKSIYHWNNEIIEDNEILMMIKSEKSKQQNLIDTLVKIHPYDTPEVIIIPIESGFKGYLNWIYNSLN